MMLQNRQSARDRLDVQANYQVNLKAELEIMRLHEKLDELDNLINVKIESIGRSKKRQ